jgi:bifunctional non-homologous end joining protein LigD
VPAHASTTVPTGPEWLHELKHDGMRVVARKAGGRVSIWSRNGRPWTTELVAITAGLRELAVDKLMLDGEAVAHCAEGLPDFHRLLGDGKATACLYAFDLLEIDGEDLRPLPLEARKERLASALQGGPDGLRLSEHMAGPQGPAMYAHACRLGLERIVSKRREKAYRSGRCPHWLKILNPSYERR